jgi:tRNA (guanine-N7-)-methyltransferase
MSEKLQKNLEQNFCYQKDFKYTHDNPYHDRLGAFDHFVLRDDEAEKNQGKWNQEVFKRNSPLMVEIGTGYGEFMIEYCQDHPDHNFIGLDHRFKRSFHLAKKLDKIENKNFRYLRARGERLHFMFNENEVDALFYFFPDPWPKTRHFKKRLFQKPFLDAAAHVLKNNGVLYIKTDHDGYYDWMIKELQNENRFKIELNTRNLRQEHPEHFLAKYKTKFEKIFISQGVLIKAIVLRNIK